MEAILGRVPSAEQANYMNLYKKVLTVKTGGQVLQASGNLARQLDDCVHRAGIYYTLTFDPPLAGHPDEYHSLKVEVSHPGLIVRASTGYYDQPFYHDPPDLRFASPPSRSSCQSFRAPMVGPCSVTFHARVDRSLELHKVRVALGISARGSNSANRSR